MRLLNPLIRSIADLEHIQIDRDGNIKASTTEDGPMVPLDHLLHANRHERRKAQALARRERRAIGADW